MDSLTMAEILDKKDAEIAELKNKVSMLEGTRLKYSDSLKADAIREMIRHFTEKEEQIGLVEQHLTSNNIRNYADKLEVTDGS